jgi:hypothetical protein
LTGAEFVVARLWPFIIPIALQPRLQNGVQFAMKNLFEAGKLLLLDTASTFFFLVVFLLTRNLPLSVILGVALGVAQIGWEFARNKPIDTMQRLPTAD